MDACITPDAAAVMLSKLPPAFVALIAKPEPGPAPKSTEKSLVHGLLRVEMLAVSAAVAAPIDTTVPVPAMAAACLIVDPLDAVVTAVVAKIDAEVAADATPADARVPVPVMVVDWSAANRLVVVVVGVAEIGVEAAADTISAGVIVPTPTMPADRATSNPLVGVTVKVPASDADAGIDTTPTDAKIPVPAMLAD